MVQTPVQKAAETEETPAQEATEEATQTQAQQVALPVVRAPVFANQVLFQYPFAQAAALPLPSADFPVIPNDPDNQEQGAFEF